MSALEIAREELPNLTDEEREYIIWNRTGFPAFWNIPTDGATPEECFRKQLRRAKKASDNAPSGPDNASKGGSAE